MFISSRIADSFTADYKVIRENETSHREDYTFLLVQKGGIIVSSGTERSVLSKGQVLLLHPDREYSLRPLSQNQVFRFRCRRAFIENNIPAGSHILCDSSKGQKEDYRELVLLLERIGILIFDEKRKHALIGALYTLLDLLRNQFLMTDPPAESKLNATEIRVENIRQYINQNYHLPIFLQTLAEEMYLSPQYLSKFIKQHMGITFNKYLNNVRLEHAFDELMHTDHTVTEIAFNNGFSNTSAFNKQFRDVYQLSPTSYRKQFALKSESNEAAAAAIPPALTMTETQNTQLLNVSYGQSQPYYPAWRDSINIGALVNALSQSFHDALLMAQGRIGFRYVRFNNIFDDEILSYIPQTDDFKFTNIDMIFDFFREIHVLPFIEICYKPAKVSLTSQHFESPDVLFQKEKAQEYLVHALDALLKHFIARYSLSEVSKWRFEIWAKHDDALNYLETVQEYWDKFEAFRNVIKQNLPTAVVGGPGYNTTNKETHFHELLTEMKKRQIQPDFLSIYSYYYAPKEEIMVDENGKTLALSNLSTDPGYLVHTFDLYRAIVNEYTSPDMPLYITEFNSGLNGYNHVAASAFQAAFIVKNALALCQRTSCFAYWHFSDISSEVFIGPRDYATGMGLIEQHGILKPGFYAYNMLAKLKSYIADSGPQYLATTDNRMSYQFIISNYQHYGQSYCFTHLNRIGIANTYDVFDEAEPKKAVIVLKDLPRGNYRCKMYILNRSHGSLVDKFLQILDYGKTSQEELEYILMNMQQEETEYYRSCAIPRMEISYPECTNGTLTFQRTMQPHEVLLIYLERRS